MSQPMSDSPDRMGALIRETFRAMIDGVEHQFDDMDLVLSQWLTLRLMASGRIECIGDVNREIGLESGSSTRLVDQLERRGLIKRNRCHEDRRVVEIHLTPRGHSVIAGMQPRLMSFWNDSLSVFSDTERQQLFDLLRRLRNVLVKQSNLADRWDDQ